MIEKIRMEEVVIVVLSSSDKSGWSQRAPNLVLMVPDF